MTRTPMHARLKAVTTALVPLIAASALLLPSATGFETPDRTPTAQETRSTRTATVSPFIRLPRSMTVLSTEGVSARAPEAAAAAPEIAATPEPTPVPELDPIEVAISAAEAQLGKPYRWASTGPNSFDCSGLMLFAFRAAGIELPRTSRAQYAGLPQVPLDQMRRGDLVFSGYRGRISHVGLYLGDGMMVHSPRSGRVVEISPLHSNLIGAARPVQG